MSYLGIAACQHKVWLGLRLRSYYSNPTFTYLSVSRFVTLTSLWRDIFGSHKVLWKDFNSLGVGSPSHLPNLMCPHELQAISAWFGVSEGAILSEASN